MAEIGEAFSHCRILHKIGQGGMGEVFLAEDTSLERKVAIKFLPQAMLSDPVSRQRFLREAKSAATLDHPHICVVHETGESGGAPYIVMEYVEGESLGERMIRGRLPLEETLRLAIEIAEALEEAHSRDIVHRDLKPANVMLTRTGHVKVMDFGLAKRLASSERRAADEETLTELTEMGTTVGTLAYMSPEQLQGQAVDHRSDIFAFGAVLYEMLAGTHPFRKEVGMATAAAILSAEPMPLAQRAPEIPPQLAKLVTEMLAKDPGRRVRSMREVHEQLKEALLEVRPRPEEAGVLNLRKLGRSLRRPRVAIPALAVLIALVFAAIWLFDRQAKVRWARAYPSQKRIHQGNPGLARPLPGPGEIGVRLQFPQFHQCTESANRLAQFPGLPSCPRAAPRGPFARSSRFYVASRLQPLANPVQITAVNRRPSAVSTSSRTEPSSSACCNRSN